MPLRIPNQRIILRRRGPPVADDPGIDSAPPLATHRGRGIVFDVLVLAVEGVHAGGQQRREGEREAMEEAA